MITIGLLDGIALRLSPRLSLRRAKTASPEPTRSIGKVENSEGFTRKSRLDERGISVSKPAYAARWKPSIWRIQLVSGFHLGKMWATNSKRMILKGKNRLPRLSIEPALIELNASALPLGVETSDRLHHDAPSGLHLLMTANGLSKNAHSRSSLRIVRRDPFSARRIANVIVRLSAIRSAAIRSDRRCSPGAPAGSSPASRPRSA
jgi:hypothetical protein